MDHGKRDAAGTDWPLWLKRMLTEMKQKPFDKKKEIKNEFSTKYKYYLLNRIKSKK